MKLTPQQKYEKSLKAKERRRSFYASEGGKACHNRYMQSEKGKAAHLRAVRKYRSRPDGKLRKVAVKKLNNAVRFGKIYKEPCIICGANKVEAHHQDYTKPLEVIWLCPTHHRRLHRGIVSLPLPV